MSAYTSIEWADHTFNPWMGCQKVGPGCDHCYAEKSTPARTLGIAWGPGAPRQRTSASTWNMPLRWNAQAEAFAAVHGRRQRVFCASLADVFDNALDPQWRADLLALIAETPHLDWLLLTKRIGNVRAMLNAAIASGWDSAPWPNVWIGTTICNQPEADRDIVKLLQVPAAVRFLSMEPLLGPVDLTAIPISGHGHHEFDPIVTANVLARAEANPPLPAVSWVIVGGESGPSARPMHPDWARNLRDQCADAGVPFLFKQWGEWVSVSEVAGDGPHHRFDDGATVRRIGKKAAGRTLDGATHDGFPEARP